MKKSYLPCLIFIVICASALGGCSRKADDDLASLKEQVQLLEENVGQLEKKVANAQAKAVSNSDSITSTTSGIDGLTSSVERMLESLEKTIPADEEAARMEQYFALKISVKQLLHNIDAYDDNLEVQYKKKLLNYTNYKIQERSAKALQEQLNDALESLKTRFRVDE